MNKSVITVLFTICLSCFQTQAQRCLPGQKGLQFTAGTVNGFNMNEQSSDFTFHAGMAFSSYLQNDNRWVLGGEYFEKHYPYKDISLPQSQFTVDAGYFLNLLSDVHKTFFVSIGASVMGGYETVNWGDKKLYDGATITNEDTLLYGGALTFETEIFLTDRIVLLVNVRERMLAGSSFGLLNTLPGLGLKFIIN